MKPVRLRIRRKTEFRFNRTMPLLNFLCRASIILAALTVMLPSYALEEGKPAPSLDILMMDGAVVKTAERKGEVVVINLWATWCTFCREEMPALETYYQRHRDEGLRLIAISMDDPSSEAQAREIMKAFGFAGAIGSQSKLKPLGRIWRLPMTFVIDRNGILRRDGSEGDPKVDLVILEKQVTPLLQAGEASRHP